MVTNGKRIADFALKSRLPSMYTNREFVDAGGLMSYGADLAESYRRVAYFVDRILKGAKPADLPVEQPTKFELVIKLKTAEQIGVGDSPGGLGAGGQGDQMRRGECQVSSDKWIGRAKDMKTKITVLTLCAMLFCAFFVRRRATSGELLRIGFLDPSTASGSAVLVDAFRRGDAQTWLDRGKEFHYRVPVCEQRQVRLTELAADLVRLKVI